MEPNPFSFRGIHTLTSHKGFVPGPRRMETALNSSHRLGSRPFCHMPEVTAWMKRSKVAAASEVTADMMRIRLKCLYNKKPSCR